MFIKFNEQNRCKQIIESGGCRSSWFVSATAAAPVDDKQVPTAQLDSSSNEEEEGGGDKSSGQIMLQMSSSRCVAVAIAVVDPYQRHNKLLIAPPSKQLLLSPSAAASKRKMLSRGGTMVTAERRPPKRMPDLISVPDLALLISGLLLAASINGSSSSQAPSPKPSNQVPSYTKMTTNGRQQLHQITARSTTASKFFTPTRDHSSSAAAFALVAAGNQQQQQQQQHPDAPKLIPLSALDRYQEGADLKLFCSASAPQTGGKIQFEWRKNNGEQLFSSPQLPPANEDESTNHRRAHLHISMMDDSSSMLRIGHLEADDSGNYTCLARNQHGADSSTVRVNVNVRLKWIREPPSELEVRAGKSVQVECDASGQPSPLISWTSLKDHQTIASKVLRFDRAQRNDSGLYECRATATQHRGHAYGGAGAGASDGLAGGELLRKVMKLTVNGEYKSHADD